MIETPLSLIGHRMQTEDPQSVQVGEVRWEPVRSIWFSAMSIGALVGGALTFSWEALWLYIASTIVVLLFGHSLGSHRKLIHDSYQCPRWLERLFVYLGVQVGLAGPLGLLHQHELRDYAQRQPQCHPFLRHGTGFWKDAWWQLHCDLNLAAPPALHLESRIADDQFYRFLERTWMLQHLLVALVFFQWGGWAFVFWGICARVATGVFGHWLIGYFAHNHGPMYHEVLGAAVQGHNVRWVSLLTMGESWHNNHHAFPGAARLGLRRGEWDPGWWVLVALEKIGLVSGCVLPSDLPARPELVALKKPTTPELLGIPRLFDLYRWTKSADVTLSAELIYPARWLNSEVLRPICERSGVRVKVDPSASRLTLGQSGGLLVGGLPTLCLLLARQSSLTARRAALVFVPLAWLVEQIRYRASTEFA